MESCATAMIIILLVQIAHCKLVLDNTVRSAVLGR